MRVGAKGTHLNTLRNFNQPLFPNGPLGNGVYHGIDTLLERRFAGGLTFRAAYTYSKSIDNTGEHLATPASFGQNGRDFHMWRRPSGQQQWRHRSRAAELEFHVFSNSRAPRKIS